MSKGREGMSHLEKDAGRRMRRTLGHRLRALLGCLLLKSMWEDLVGLQRQVWIPSTWVPPKRKSLAGAKTTSRSKATPDHALNQTWKWSEPVATQRVQHLLGYSCLMSEREKKPHPNVKIFSAEGKGDIKKWRQLLSQWDFRLAPLIRAPGWEERTSPRAHSQRHRKSCNFSVCFVSFGR